MTYCLVSVKPLSRPMEEYCWFYPREQIQIAIKIFSFAKMHLKMSAKWRASCFVLNVLKYTCFDENHPINIPSNYAMCHFEASQLDNLLAILYLLTKYTRDYIVSIAAGCPPGRHFTSRKKTMPTVNKYVHSQLCLLTVPSKDGWKVYWDWNVSTWDPGIHQNDLCCYRGFFVWKIQKCTLLYDIMIWTNT